MFLFALCARVMWVLCLVIVNMIMKAVAGGGEGRRGGGGGGGGCYAE